VVPVLWPVRAACRPYLTKRGYRVRRVQSPARLASAQVDSLDLDAERDLVADDSGVAAIP